MTYIKGFQKALNYFISSNQCLTAAHQAPPSLGFSRQEHWSGLPFPSPMHESEKWKWSRSVVSDPQRPHRLQPTRLLHPWDLPGKSTGVGCHCLLRSLLLPYDNTWNSFKWLKPNPWMLFGNCDVLITIIVQVPQIHTYLPQKERLSQKQ